ncbi:MAG: DMT family transporter [Burkholderiales bacterium]
MSEERAPVDGVAIGVMVLLTALWGFQQVTVKWIAADVPLVMQAALRSIIATVLLLGWARLRGVALFGADGTGRAGFVAGLLFAGEFVFIYAGLAHTNASRMSVFIYLAPPLTALGLHAFVPSERLSVRQWAGVLLAFAGIVAAFAEGFGRGGATWLGDLCGVIAAALWVATTVVIRATRLSRATATKTLFYQLGVSALALPLASVLLGEKGIGAVTPLVAASLAYQGAIVAFASYLAWFWLLTRYRAAPLAVLSFLTPMFGVLSGAVFLSEPISRTFVAAALCVAVGIVLVNLRR